jgi:hypothetical protein
MIASERLRRVVVPIAFVLALCGLCTACDPVDGTQMYALWEVCDHPAGAFHFHYLEPPWEKARGFSADAPVFLLDPSSEPSGQVDDPGARVRLEAYASEADSVAEEAEARRARWIDDGYIVDAPETFSNRAGDVGIVQRASFGGSRVAEVFFDGVGIAVLSLWGRGSIGDEDYRLLLESFEPRGSGAH